MTNVEYREMLALQQTVYDLQMKEMHPDLDAAAWMLGRAFRKQEDAAKAIQYAKDAIAVVSPSQRARVEMKTRTLTKEEHDALLDGPTPRGVSREDYERMMLEAQE